jgi:hypothetical protein
MELAVGVMQQQWQAEQWLTHTQSHTRCALKQPIPFPVVCNCWLIVFLLLRYLLYSSVGCWRPDTLNTYLYSAVVGKLLLPPIFYYL